MTVKELIKQLRNEKPNKTVILYDENTDIAYTPRDVNNSVMGKTDQSMYTAIRFEGPTKKEGK